VETIAEVIVESMVDKITENTAEVAAARYCLRKRKSTSRRKGEKSLRKGKKIEGKEEEKK